MRRLALIAALAAVVMLFAVATPASAAVPPIMQTPDTTGMSFLAGSSLTVSWVAVGVPDGVPLTLWLAQKTESGGMINQPLYTDLAHVDSYEVTIPEDAGQYFYYLTATIDLGGGSSEVLVSDAYSAYQEGYGWWFTIDTLPQVTLNPYGTSVPVGFTATFYADAVGVPEPTCQWQVDDGSGSGFVDIDGATGTSYETPATTIEMDGWRYRAVFTNRQGSISTDEVILTVEPEASITQLPAMGGQTYNQGEEVTISWESVGLEPDVRLVLIQEYVEPDQSDAWPIATELPQSGSYTVTIPTAIAGTKYSYYLCTAWEDGGASGVFSDQFGQFFDVIKRVAPIQQWPNTTDQSYLGGSKLTIEWESTGLPDGARLTLYEAERNEGGTASSHNVVSDLPLTGSYDVTIPSSGGPYFYYLEYTVYYPDGSGFTWWSQAHEDYDNGSAWWFTIDTLPEVDVNPVDRSVREYESATFDAAAIGLPAPTCQWQVNDGSGWVDIDGATSTSYTVPEVAEGMNGWLFRAVFTNKYGSATTDAAMLTVEPDPAITQTPAMTGLQLFAGGPLTISWTSVSLDPSLKLTLYCAEVTGLGSYHIVSSVPDLSLSGSTVVNVPSQPGTYFYYLYAEWTDADGIHTVYSDQYDKHFEVVPPLEIKISAPTVTPEAPRPKRAVSFEATVTPAAASDEVTFTLHLLHWETRRIGGKRVPDWYEITTIPMTVTNASLGKIGATGKVPERGDWKIYVKSETGMGFAGAQSDPTTFSVR